MNMTYVSSSNLVEVGYDNETKTLRIQFKSGMYDYYDVPSDVFQGLLSAPSKGQFHHQYIKNNYRYKRIG